MVRKRGFRRGDLGACPPVPSRIVLFENRLPSILFRPAVYRPGMVSSLAFS